MCFTECEHCGKEFWYSVEVTREYNSWTDEEDKEMMNNAKELLEQEGKQWK